MIGLAGINHKTSPIEIREQFSISKEEIIPFSELLQDDTGISDIVVLSTCNRTEIYFSQMKYDNVTAAKLIYRTLKKFKGIENKYWHLFYNYGNSEAVRHLFEVSSGIDSMIIGEDQIIGQIKEAYQYCTDAALTDAVLMRLFQKSFEAGKRVRSETKIKMGTTSISSAAVQKCFQLYDSLNDKRVLMIGAGDTGRLVLQHLNKSGVKRITVSNRTEEKAKRLAERYRCAMLPFDQMANHLFLYDIIIVATGSSVPLVTREMITDSQEKRENKPQVFVDISVPRNIEKNVEEMENIQLFTIDALQKTVDTNVEKRMHSVSSAREIIDEIVDEFSEWLSSRSLRPAIKMITEIMQKVSNEELLGYYKADTEDKQQAINEFSTHLTQKYTRLFIKNLKEITENGKNTESLQIINKLFNFVYEHEEVEE
ncbi:glutamyl-tRNA reductase [Maribellus comscasis]|uniref:Glutamyl-tRNA reductase n=1 Tax=Maribellus comscasis TaxID=2681766 RepID=A0A6I6JYH4_9BACT|nr:glutamyl-tRNA reductase [Maribellus comscasis]QGY44193.1 glutamyl-tRNA reductase [Maribellus comscasis]